MQVIRWFLTLINFITPKRNRIVIQVFPDFEDNGVALAKQLFKSQDREIIFINPSKRYFEFIEKGTNIRVLSAKSLLSIYYLLTSKYLFFTHGSLFRNFSKNQVTFNMWHGFGYKPVGKLIGGNAIDANYTAVTTNNALDLFSHTFGVCTESIKVTGYPRNDRLFGNSREEILKKIGVNPHKFVLIWLPTYRKAVVGDCRLDGFEVANPFGIENFNLQIFNEFLEVHNAVCVLKQHPMAQIYEIEKKFNNIHIITDKIIHDLGITLYPILGVSDALISDVSSVIIDYLVIDKPILCFIQDLQQYKITRGFVFDNIEEMIPGPIAITINEFYLFLENLFKDKDLLPQKRRDLLMYFHRYVDNQSSRRVQDVIFNNAIS